MAKHKYKNKNKNKNKNNNSPAVAPKAKFSTPQNGAKKTQAKSMNEKAKKAESSPKSPKKTSVIIEKTKNRKLIYIVSAIALVLLVALAATLVVLLSNRIPELAVSEYNGQNATVSTVSDITVDEGTQLERYNEIKRKIKGDKKEFKFYARPSIEIDEKYKEGIIMFSNLTVNDCTLILTIMDEEDDIIFRSMGIAPGKCMQRLSLTKTLTFGEHEVTMYVTAYDSETYEIIGTQYMKLDLMFGNEYSASEESDYSTTEPTVNPNVTRPVEATSATATTKHTTTTTTTTEKSSAAVNSETDKGTNKKTTKAEKGSTNKAVKTTAKSKTTKKVAPVTKKAS